MELREFFKAVGGDYDKVLMRLQSESLILKFVKRFKDDPTIDELIQAFEEKRVQDAFRAAHTMKGTAANLGLDALAEKASDLTELLRNSDTLPDRTFLENVIMAYDMTIGKIDELN